MPHPLTTDNSINLGIERQSRYQAQLYAASADLIELARLLQVAAGINIEGIAPLYISQATFISEHRDHAASMAYFMGRATHDA